MTEKNEVKWIVKKQDQTKNTHNNVLLIVVWKFSSILNDCFDRNKKLPLDITFFSLFLVFFFFFFLKFSILTTLLDTLDTHEAATFPFYKSLFTDKQKMGEKKENKANETMFFSSDENSTFKF